MEFTETMNILAEMEIRYHDGFSFSDKEVIEQLHRQLLHREIENKSCSDCYRDAYMQIMILLKKNNAMPNPKVNYVLKGGAILRTAGSNKFYANPLPNDKVAEEYLAQFPDKINIFAQFPTDWEERVARRKAGLAEEKKGHDGELEQLIATVNSLKDEVESLNEKCTLLENENASLKAGDAIASNGSDDIATLRLELDSALAEVETLRTELAEVKKVSHSDESLTTKGRRKKIE